MSMGSEPKIISAADKRGVNDVVLVISDVVEVVEVDVD